MTQAPEIARPAGAPAAGAPAAGGPPDFQAMAQMYLRGHLTGLEGREDEFGRAVLNVIKTLKDSKPYPHEVNDALVKSWLVGIKFARKHDLLAEYVQNDVDTLKPITKRMGDLARMTNEPELALEAICGWSTCHYHLVPTETIKSPGARTFLSPFKTALDAGHRVGQFDFDEKFVHDAWFTPRAHGLAADLGFPIEVSPWDDETRMVTVSLA
jgi:hypothetical protein